MGFKAKIKEWLKNRLFRLLNETRKPKLIESTNNIIAGKESYHNGDFIVKGRGRLLIGNYCAFGNNIKIILSNHAFNLPAVQYTIYYRLFNEHPNVRKSFKEVDIGNDVWIGDNVVILPGVKIGDGACIGAGSIVTRNIEDFSINAGNPAKLIKYRFSKSNREKLKKMEWWNMDENQMAQMKPFFFEDLN